MPLAWIAAFGLLLVAVAGQAAPLRFCAEDEDSYPWLLKDGQGLNSLMMRLIESRVGQPIRVERQPWRRCLQSLRDNQVDGAFKASFSAERQAFAHYPLRDGKLDERRRMLTESYHLYVRKGVDVQWDGRQLVTGGGPVGAQSGFSVVGLLRDKGALVDDGTRVTEAIVIKLLRGRIVAAALQTQQGDHLLSRHPEWSEQLERLEPPLIAKPYYLLLSRDLVARDGALAERLWDAVAEVRESRAYQQALSAFD